MSCWNCGASPSPGPFCDGCGKVAVRQTSQTHFMTLGLPFTLSPARADVEKAYRERSLLLHPDRLAGAEGLERRLSAEQAVALNDAYRVLKDPVRRLFYVLKLQGIDLEKEEGGQRQAVDPDFLEEIMELREALSDLRDDGNLDAAQSLATRVKAQQDAALTEAEEALALRMKDPTDAAALQRAARALARVRYHLRFLEEVADMEEEAFS